MIDESIEEKRIMQSNAEHAVLHAGLMEHFNLSTEEAERLANYIEAVTVPRGRHDQMIEIRQKLEETRKNDSYQQGLYNGVELSLAVVENREPVYSMYLKPRPDTWHQRIFGVNGFTFYFCLFGLLMFAVMGANFGAEAAFTGVIFLILIYAFVVPIERYYERN